MLEEGFVIFQVRNRERASSGLGSVGGVLGLELLNSASCFATGCGGAVLDSVDVLLVAHTRCGAVPRDRPVEAALLDYLVASLAWFLTCLRARFLP